MKEIPENDVVPFVQKDWGNLALLVRLRPDLVTHDVCVAAVTASGMALAYVPKEMCTLSMCWIAVWEMATALCFVPEALRVPEMCLAAVRKEGTVLHQVPLAHRNHDMCFAAVKQNGLALKDVPDELKTPEMCLLAVRSNGLAIMAVPEKLAPDMAQLAVLSNVSALRYVHDLPNAQFLYEAAVREWGGQALVRVPPDRRTAEMFETVARTGDVSGLARPSIDDLFLVA